MIKTKTARKLLIALVALSLGVMFNLPSVQAAALTSQSVSLTDSNPTDNASYTFNFTSATTATLTEIDLVFSTSATGGSTPHGLDTTTSAFGGGHITASDDSSWTYNHATNGTLKFTDAGDNLTSPSAATIAVTGITNPTLGDGLGGYQCGATSSGGAATCFVQITTKSAGNTTVDTGAATFSIEGQVTASATVDPSLTLAVAGVTSGITNARSQQTNVSSTYSTLPFGHLTAGGATAIAAQSLTVSTNANNGFAVSMAMPVLMTGSGTSAKISPFHNASAGTWAVPVAWTAPTGNAKDGSGTLSTNEASALGASTTDTNVSGWSGTSNVWGPVPMTAAPVNDTAKNVMQSSSSINNDVQTVSYQIGVDAYQPADIYSGTIQYFAIPTY